MCCMLEGESLLLFCSETDNFVKAAFALTSPPSLRPTFSRFALVLRELDWTLDFLCCLDQKYLGINSSFHDWKWNWCKERSRLIFQSNLNNGIVGMEDDTLKADGRRQTNDREALRVDLKSNRRWLWTPFVLQHKLQAILMKRMSATSSDNPGPSSLSDLLPIDSMEDVEITKRIASEATTSHTPQKITVPNWFCIDNPEDFEPVKLIAAGSFKKVKECKWLGETVAVAESNWPKENVEAEAGLLARVQHPNVVELLGYAYKDDIRHPEGFIVTELMEQDLETLISQEVRKLGPEYSKKSPFPLPVVFDIALQIVEAMIQLKECGVLHRDLKPKNCLASAKYNKNSLAGCSNVIPIHYTIKLIDFGSAKMRGNDSYFHTYRRGTLYYMAPEMYDKPEGCTYTWPADVYSFGITLYEVFTGRAPFENFTRFQVVRDFISRGGRPPFPFERYPLNNSTNFRGEYL
ncbi:hypothetical protein KC19_9G087000 [Ceratodon purpureus]|uniref:Protein kinase domain-containing protein n=1 Tax=Ceratodon purpureus TaxID=3225 RepID=A0A8T0GS32_CERPU|nr:hypothetical protein KC19_9G087000 [Ceratodon purpureus]